MLIDIDFVLPETKPSSAENDTFNDVWLWSYIKAGNELAFSVLYKRYVDRIYNYGMHCCKHRELVKDCLQALFVKIWSDRETLHVSGTFNHYLLKSFRRLLVERLLSHRRSPVLFQGSSSGDLNFTLPVDAFINDGGAKNHQRKIPAVNLSLLNERQREAIFLKFFNGLSYDETSSVMGLHGNAAYDLISTALEVMRED